MNLLGKLRDWRIRKSERAQLKEDQSELRKELDHMDRMYSEMAELEQDSVQGVKYHDQQKGVVLDNYPLRWTEPTWISEKRRLAEENGWKCYYGLTPNLMSRTRPPRINWPVPFVEGRLLPARYCLTYFTDEGLPSIEVSYDDLDDLLLRSTQEVPEELLLDDNASDKEIEAAILNPGVRQWSTVAPGWNFRMCLGKAKLAANILADTINEKIAEENYAAFTREVVVGFTEPNWAITEEEILEWLMHKRRK